MKNLLKLNANKIKDFKNLLNELKWYTNELITSLNSYTQLLDNCDNDILCENNSLKELGDIPAYDIRAYIKILNELIDDFDNFDDEIIK